ncbi:MAG: GTPase domain-containing protein [Trichocoleus desertorum ATA4-8-CV12]|jgi:GTPase Era involved in 16S rRNA processing|nr:GTPase domain-containing protein [Trichocoleus desertorum ATA4-8-CV12]
MVKEIVEVGGEVVEVGRRIWEQFDKSYTSDYHDENSTTLSKTLHRMHTGSSPRIVLVGMTSAGKSSLINALFGESIAEVKRTADTTDCIIEAKFPSSLVIYDTPGLGGNEELGYENITRLFLRLPQEEDVKIHGHVRYQAKPAEILELSIEQISQFPTPDAIIFVVDISRTLNRFERKAFKALYLELQNKFANRVVVAGTHLDELRQLPKEEINGQISSYNNIFDEQVIPVSSLSGEGLSELVLTLFRTIPEKVSPAKLQESLVTARKLSRLSFVIAEVSNILADIILLKGNRTEEIKAGYLGIFALVCNHYSVDEEIWLKCNGNALKIGEEAKDAGTRRFKSRRNPKDLFEWLMSIFGGGIYIEEVEYKSLGSAGLRTLLPGIYKLLYELSEVSSVEFSEIEVREQVNHKADEIEKLVQHNKFEELSSQVSLLLEGLFPGVI